MWFSQTEFLLVHSCHKYLKRSYYVHRPWSWNAAGPPHHCPFKSSAMATSVTLGTESTPGSALHTPIRIFLCASLDPYIQDSSPSHPVWISNPV